MKIKTLVAVLLLSGGATCAFFRGEQPVLSHKVIVTPTVVFPTRL